jgi:hypothetical protein
MNINELSKNYFNGFKDLANYKKNSVQANFSALAKILSYLTGFIPLAVIGARKIASLVDRAQKKELYSQLDEMIKKISNELKNTTPPTLPQPVADPLNISPVVTPSSIHPCEKLPSATLDQVLHAYSPFYRPEKNLDNLLAYETSDELKRHQDTARVYYNASQMSQKDALKVVFQREPTNIAQRQNQFFKDKLKKLFGYEAGVYNDTTLKKSDDSFFREAPNSVCIYSETFMWNPPGENEKKAIACISVPFPALDTQAQPHFSYYVQNKTLNSDRYKEELVFLFKSIEKALRDNKDTAFERTGIKRVVLSRISPYGFLDSLKDETKEDPYTEVKKACQIFVDQMDEFIERIQDTGIEVVMSESIRPKEPWLDEMIIGNIFETAKAGDFIVNAWNPHSAPGNGNDLDLSFNGVMGKCSGILLTQTSWINAFLRQERAYEGLN